MIPHTTPAVITTVLSLNLQILKTSHGLGQAWIGATSLSSNVKCLMLHDYALRTLHVLKIDVGSRSHTTLTCFDVAPCKTCGS